MERVKIIDATGAVVRQSKNLRGLVEFASNHNVHLVSIHRINTSPDDPDGNGQLIVYFDGGYTCSHLFASFHVLCEWLRRSRNLCGATLHIDNTKSGIVGPSNPALKTDAHGQRIITPAEHMAMDDINQTCIES